jgi:hypothetical protein
MRRILTAPERLLWSMLRNQLDLYYRRGTRLVGYCGIGAGRVSIGLMFWGYCK